MPLLPNGLSTSSVVCLSCLDVMMLVAISVLSSTYYISACEYFLASLSLCLVHMQGGISNIGDGFGASLCIVRSSRLCDRQCKYEISIGIFGDAVSIVFCIQTCPFILNVLARSVNRTFFTMHPV